MKGGLDTPGLIFRHKKNAKKVQTFLLALRREKVCFDLRHFWGRGGGPDGPSFMKFTKIRFGAGETDAGKARHGRKP